MKEGTDNEIINQRGRDNGDLLLAILVILSTVAFGIYVWMHRDEFKNTPPDIQKAEESREKHVDSAEKLEPIVKEIVRDRWRTKHHFDTIIQEVLRYDSAETDHAFDSLIGTKNNAVVIYYKGLSDSIQLAKMDTVHGLDSLRIHHLTAANLACDTLIDYYKKQAKKERNKKVFWQCVSGGLGALLIVK